METPAKTNQTTSSFKAGLYWRKGYLAAMCPPGILSLQNNSLSFKTKDAVIFDSPLEQCSFYFTKLGTMKVTIGDKHYDFSGQNGVGAQAFDQSLLDELSASGAQHAVSLGGASTTADAGVVAKNITTGVTAAAGEAIGAAAAGVGIAKAAKSLGVIRDWVPILQGHQAKITDKSVTGGKFVLYVFGIVFAISAAIVLLLLALGQQNK